MDNQPSNPAPTLASEKVMIDNKVFFIDLKENQRGRFLKITEDVKGRRDTILMPITAAASIAQALERLIDIEEAM
jgi:hypothetical protein